MNENNNLDFLQKYKDIAIIILVMIVGFYAFMYVNNGFNINDIGSGGAIGDFFGGMLNPIFALLGFFALLETIKIQNKELKTSNEALQQSGEELGLTREQATLSAKALREQSESIKLQNFENTFFKMLDLHNEIVKSLTYSGKQYYIEKGNSPIILSYGDGKEMKSVEVLNNLLLQFKNKLLFFVSNHHQKDRTNTKYLNVFKQYDQSVSKYFRNLYQILKFISCSSINNKKFYSNILRAQLSHNELELLFYHCASDFGSEKFILLLIEFEFLEHLVYDSHINEKDVIFYIENTLKLNQEDLELGYNVYKVFGKNAEWKAQVEKLFQITFTTSSL
jgi:hypothetical protein